MAQLIDDWHAARRAWEAANDSGQPVRECNRLITKARKLGAEIAAKPDLWPLIESMCSAEFPAQERLDAALVREHWDLRGASETLVDIIRTSGEKAHRPMTMTAALALEDPIAWTAGMCLMNIDRGGGNVGQSDHAPRLIATIDEKGLRAADQVHALAQNGGLDHAYHVAGEQFATAATAFDGLGLHSAAAVLRELLELASDSPSMEIRAEALSRIPDADLEALTARYDALEAKVGDVLAAD